MKKKLVIILIALLLIPTTFAFPVLADTQVTDSFERKNVLGTFWRSQYTTNPWSAQTSTKQAREGTKSLRFELRSTDKNVSDSKRAEVEYKKVEPPLLERTYKVSVYLPKGGKEDYALDPSGSEIICQWHNTPDSGEDWTSPPLLLRTGAYDFVDGDHYSVQVHWDANAITTDETMQNQVYDLGSYVEDKGKWVDWTVHVKWGWLDSQKPRIQIYKDGVKVFDRVGPNTTNDKVGPYMQFGMYKWDWAHPEYKDSILKKRVIYYDAVNIT